MAFPIPNFVIDKIYSHNNITTYPRPDMLINSYVWALGNDFGNVIEREEMKKSKKQKLKEQCVALATKIKLIESPYCLFCGKKAHTAHHFIHQSRSNHLRCDPRNLIPICKSCHYKLHQGYEQIFTGILIKKLGQKWFDDLERDSQIKIKDNLGYWQELKADLEKKLAQLQGGEV